MCVRTSVPGVHVLGPKDDSGLTPRTTRKVCVLRLFATSGSGRCGPTLHLHSLLLLGSFRPFGDSLPWLYLDLYTRPERQPLRLKQNRLPSPFRFDLVLEDGRVWHPSLLSVPPLTLIRLLLDQSSDVQIKWIARVHLPPVRLTIPFTPWMEKKISIHLCTSWQKICCYKKLYLRQHTERNPLPCRGLCLDTNLGRSVSSLIKFYKDLIIGG